MCSTVLCLYLELHLADDRVIVVVPHNIGLFCILICKIPIYWPN